MLSCLYLKYKKKIFVMVLYGRQRQHWHWWREASKVTSSSFLHSASFSSSPKPTEICKRKRKMKKKKKSATARNSRADFSILSILPPFSLFFLVRVWLLIMRCPGFHSTYFYLVLDFFSCHYREAKGTEYTDYKLYQKNFILQ